MPGLPEGGAAVASRPARGGGGGEGRRGRRPLQRDQRGLQRTQRPGQAAAVQRGRARQGPGRRCGQIVGLGGARFLQRDAVLLCGQFQHLAFAFGLRFLF